MFQLKRRYKDGLSAFSVSDCNCDNYLSRGEFQRLFIIWNNIEETELIRSQLNRLFTILDIDGDGFLSKKEFDGIFNMAAINSDFPQNSNIIRMGSAVDLYSSKKMLSASSVDSRDIRSKISRVLTQNSSFEKQINEQQSLQRELKDVVANLELEITQLMNEMPENQPSMHELLSVINERAEAAGILDEIPVIGAWVLAHETKTEVSRQQCSKTAQLHYQEAHSHISSLEKQRPSRRSSLQSSTSLANIQSVINNSNSLNSSKSSSMLSNRGAPSQIIKVKGISSRINDSSKLSSKLSNNLAVEASKQTHIMPSTSQNSNSTKKNLTYSNYPRSLSRISTSMRNLQMNSTNEHINSTSLINRLHDLHAQEKTFASSSFNPASKSIPAANAPGSVNNLKQKSERPEVKTRLEMEPVRSSLTLSSANPIPPLAPSMNSFLSSRRIDKMTSSQDLRDKSYETKDNSAILSTPVRYEDTLSNYNTDNTSLELVFTPLRPRTPLPTLQEDSSSFSLSMSPTNHVSRRQLLNSTSIGSNRKRCSIKSPFIDTEEKNSNNHSINLQSPSTQDVIPSMNIAASKDLCISGFLSDNSSAKDLNIYSNNEYEDNFKLETAIYSSVERNKRLKAADSVSNQENKFGERPSSSSNLLNNINNSPVSNLKRNLSEGGYNQLPVSVQDVINNDSCVLSSSSSSASIKFPGCQDLLDGSFSNNSADKVDIFAAASSMEIVDTAVPSLSSKNESNNIKPPIAAVSSLSGLLTVNRYQTASITLPKPDSIVFSEPEVIVIQKLPTLSIASEVFPAQTIINKDDVISNLVDSDHQYSIKEATIYPFSRAPNTDTSDPENNTVAALEGGHEIRNKGVSFDTGRMHASEDDKPMKLDNEYTAENDSSFTVLSANAQRNFSASRLSIACKNDDGKISSFTQRVMAASSSLQPCNTQRSSSPNNVYSMNTIKTFTSQKNSSFNELTSPVVDNNNLVLSPSSPELSFRENISHRMTTNTKNNDIMLISSPLNNLGSQVASRATSINNSVKTPPRIFNTQFSNRTSNFIETTHGIFLSPQKPDSFHADSTPLTWNDFSVQASPVAQNLSPYAPSLKPDQIPGNQDKIFNKSPINQNQNGAYFHQLPALNHSASAPYSPSSNHSNVYSPNVFSNYSPVSIPNTKPVSVMPLSSNNVGTQQSTTSIMTALVDSKNSSTSYKKKSSCLPCCESKSDSASLNKHNSPTSDPLHVASALVPTNLPLGQIWTPAKNPTDNIQQALHHSPSNNYYNTPLLHQRIFHYTAENNHGKENKITRQYSPATHISRDESSRIFAANSHRDGGIARMPSPLQSPRSPTPVPVENIFDEVSYALPFQEAIFTQHHKANLGNENDSIDISVMSVAPSLNHQNTFSDLFAFNKSKENHINNSNAVYVLPITSSTNEAHLKRAETQQQQLVSSTLNNYSHNRQLVNSQGKSIQMGKASQLVAQTLSGGAYSPPAPQPNVIRPTNTTNNLVNLQNKNKNPQLSGVSNSAQVKKSKSMSFWPV